MTDNFSHLSSIASLKYSQSSRRSFNDGSGDSDDDNYVLHCALNCVSSRLAIHVSNDTDKKPVKILDTETLTEVSCVKSPLPNLNSRVKFLSQNGNHLMVSSCDSIQLYDTRHTTTKVSKQWQITVPNEYIDASDLNRITCFDVNCDNMYLIAGTEQCPDQNVYLHFWDIRNPNQMIGSYYETHTNDITTVEFSPNSKNIVATGGCDELINIFDINEPEESDALITTLNTESSIERVKWCMKNDSYRNLICITQDETVQFWDYDDAKPYFVLNHRNSCLKFDYIIDAIDYDDIICVGDGNGAVTMVNAERLETEIEITAKSFLSKGHNKMVRTVAAANDGSHVYTGGEDALLCVWTRDASDANGNANKNGNKRKTKLKRSEKQNRVKPY